MSNDTDTTEILDALEALARQCCYTGDDVMGGRVTDSGAVQAYAGALAVLAKHGRFRAYFEGDRMVVGYWPEHDLPNTAGQRAGDSRYAAPAGSALNGGGQ